MNTQTTTKMYILAFIMGGVWGSLSYLAAFICVILAFIVNAYWTPVNEWAYVAAGLGGWLLGACLEIKWAAK